MFIKDVLCGYMSLCCLVLQTATHVAAWVGAWWIISLDGMGHMCAYHDRDPISLKL